MVLPLLDTNPDKEDIVNAITNSIANSTRTILAIVVIVAALGTVGIISAVSSAMNAM